MLKRQIILASRSPRRRELLQQIGIVPQIIDADIDERALVGEFAADYAARLAREKAEAGRRIFSESASLSSANFLVIAADTIVVLDDADKGESLLGKPVDRDSAILMLGQLSGKTHRVLTAVCVSDGQRSEQAVSQTLVSFRSLGKEEILAYWDSGEPADKAGSYAIQGLAAIFIERIEGSYSGVMGLPLAETADLLSRFGIELLP